MRYILAVILIAGLLVGCENSSTPQVLTAATPTSEPTATPTILQSTVKAISGLNVRTEPTTQGRVLRILPFQAHVKLTGRSRQSEGLIWVELDPDGWVQERYLHRS